MSADRAKFSMQAKERAFRTFVAMFVHRNAQGLTPEQFQSVIWQVQMDAYDAGCGCSASLKSTKCDDPVQQSKTSA